MCAAKTKEVFFAIYTTMRVRFSRGVRVRPCGDRDLCSTVGTIFGH